LVPKEITISTTKRLFITARVCPSPGPMLSQIFPEWRKLCLFQTSEKIFNHVLKINRNSHRTVRLVAIQLTRALSGGDVRHMLCSRHCRRNRKSRSSKLTETATSTCCLLLNRTVRYAWDLLEHCKLLFRQLCVNESVVLASGNVTYNNPETASRRIIFICLTTYKP
jgi:hypothetical protein